MCYLLLVERRVRGSKTSAAVLIGMTLQLSPKLCNLEKFRRTTEPREVQSTIEWSESNGFLGWEVACPIFVHVD